MHTEQTRPMKSKLVGQSGESELEVTGTNELSGWAEVADFPSPCASGISSGGPGWEETVCVHVLCLCMHVPLVGTAPQSYACISSLSPSL